MLHREGWLMMGEKGSCRREIAERIGAPERTVCFLRYLYEWVRQRQSIQT